MKVWTETYFNVHKHSSQTWLEQTACLEQGLMALVNQLGLAIFQIFDKLANLLIVCRVDFFLYRNRRLTFEYVNFAIRSSALVFAAISHSFSRVCSWNGLLAISTSVCISYINSGNIFTFPEVLYHSECIVGFWSYSFHMISFSCLHDRETWLNNDVTTTSQREGCRASVLVRKCFSSDEDFPSLPKGNLKALISSHNLFRLSWRNPPVSSFYPRWLSKVIWWHEQHIGTQHE